MYGLEQDKISKLMNSGVSKSVNSGGFLKGLSSALPGIGTAVSLIPSIYKTISGISQVARGKGINPINPGYQVNSGVIDNARILGNRYTNYEMAGYGDAVNNLNTAASASMDMATQGASSSGDIIDAATKINYGTGQNLNDLAVQSAQGKDQALLQSLDAKAAAGQEYQNKNAYDRQLYQGKLNEKAALIQGGNDNIYGGLDQIGSVAGAALNPKASQIDFSKMTPDQIMSLIAGFNKKG